MHILKVGTQTPKDFRTSQLWRKYGGVGGDEGITKKERKEKKRKKIKLDFTTSRGTSILLRECTIFPSSKFMQQVKYMLASLSLMADCIDQISEPKYVQLTQRLQFKNN